jgi:hypothetical protein
MRLENTGAPNFTQTIPETGAARKTQLWLRRNVSGSALHTVFICQTIYFTPACRPARRTSRRKASLAGAFFPMHGRAT